MAGTFEETLLSVWRQVLVDDFAVVVLDDHAVGLSFGRGEMMIPDPFAGSAISGLPN